MSDVQSILLILVFFYFLESLKWMPLGAVALTSGVFGRPKWHLQTATVHFFGIKKSLFVAPLIPSFQLQLVTPSLGDRSHRDCAIKTVSGVSRRLFQLRIRTLGLRLLSLSVFATYFLCLPALYVNFGLGSYVYMTVGVGYLLQVICAICYFSVHRRFFRKELGQRILHTFYNFCLPWHAMRASDEFFLKSSANWSELAILGAFREDEAPRQQLALYWRQSQLLKEFKYSAESLKPVLDEVGLSVEDAMQISIAADVEGMFCPCCAAVYRAEVEMCADCRGSRLQRLESDKS